MLGVLAAHDARGSLARLYSLFPMPRRAVLACVPAGIYERRLRASSEGALGWNDAAVRLSSTGRSALPVAVVERRRGSLRERHRRRHRKHQRRLLRGRELLNNQLSDLQRVQPAGVDGVAQVANVGAEGAEDVAEGSRKGPLGRALDGLPSLRGARGAALPAKVEARILVLLAAEITQRGGLLGARLRAVGEAAVAGLLVAVAAHRGRTGPGVLLGGSCALLGGCGSRLRGC